MCSAKHVIRTALVALVALALTVVTLAVAQPAVKKDGAPQESSAMPDNASGEGPALPRVYVIGDSISIHYGPYLEPFLQGFATYARKADGDEAAVNIDNPRGANGGDSSMVLRFVEATEKADGFKADVLVLNCGLHDIKTDPKTGDKQVSIEQYEQNLGKILDSAKRMGLRPVWIRTTPVDENVHNKPDSSFYRFAADCAAYNEVADRVMKERAVPSIDLFTFTSNLGEDLYIDHVHFSPAIREKQAAFIAGWLSAWLGAKRAP